MSHHYTKCKLQRLVCAKNSLKAILIRKDSVISFSWKYFVKFSRSMFLRTLLGSWFWSLLSVRRIYLTKSSDIKCMLTNKEINAGRIDSKWLADCAAFKNVKLTNAELSLSTWMQWKNWRTRKLFSKVVCPREYVFSCFIMNFCLCWS